MEMLMFCLTGMTGNVVVVSNSNLGVNDQKGFLLSVYLKTEGRLFFFLNVFIRDNTE